MSKKNASLETQIQYDYDSLLGWFDAPLFKREKIKIIKKMVYNMWQQKEHLLFLEPLEAQ